METTFITIHDLTRDARILYASDSIVDILGHTPDEVVNKPSWDFFHPDEIQSAMLFHDKGLKLDKAAVLSYCQIRNRQGYYITCECCFSVCYDVLVCCTSIYRRDITSHKRAVEAPIVRRLFASSPKDPRYHMLTHLSSKFNQKHSDQTREPRSALFLNRFTRTLTIMYATSGIEQIIGLSGEEMKGKSFYYCIAENCLEDAVKCLETAKANDSIAYLRFWFRDPRQDEHHQREASPTDTDVSMTDVTTSEDESEGGETTSSDTHDTNESSWEEWERSNDRRTDAERPGISNGSSEESSGSGSSRHGSGDSTGQNGTSSGSATSTSSSSDRPFNEPIELEAVVSCTSDGLVVCLRRARSLMPQPTLPPIPGMERNYGPGLFAAPWATDPILPTPYPQVPYIPATAVPQQIRDENNLPTGPPVSASRPAQAEFLKAITDVGVFAWALTGINGSLVEYTRGKPKGECQPPDGLPVWSPTETDSGFGSSRQASASRSATNSSGRDPFGFGDPGLNGRNGSYANGNGSYFNGAGTFTDGNGRY